jgi:hypothetical protein
MKLIKCLYFLTGLLITLAFASCNKEKSEKIHVYETREIVLQANNNYENPYKEVKCWVDLKGPGTRKKIYGFWNGKKEFVFRVVATKPGKWTWESHSNQEDNGLNGHSGSFTAIKWEKEDLKENPNRRGFIKPAKNGRALEYADGTPFFMLGDTWWAASTWRYPLKGIEPDPNYTPHKGISFEEALSFRKKQGYNTIAMIAAYPNWKVDSFPAEYMNEDSVGIRQAWGKNGMNTAKDMHDESGNMPFESWDQSKIIANFDRLNPDYFKSLDKKIQYLHNHGFVTFLETVRRDHGPSWKKYFEWPESFARYVNYIIARYGAYNIIFSGIHLDWINKDYSLTANEFNDALIYHYNTYGELPYGQPHSILIDGSTYRQFGHGEAAPWLTMHSVGNVPRNHGFYPMIEEIFRLNPPYPVANLEPYYPGWDSEYHNTVAGERPEPNSKRDNYFARAQMYGSVLSGGLAGHIYGTGAYDGNTTGEPKGKDDRPYIWEAMKYPSGAQLQHLGKFILSEGDDYQNCKPAKELLIPHKAKDAPEDGLDGWSFLLLSPNKELGFIYFENKCEAPKITKLKSNTHYSLQWFDPINGKWTGETLKVKTNKNGNININKFPGGKEKSLRDWCLKLKIQ